MKEGNYIAHEYTITLNGRPTRGRFEGMNKDPEISKLDEESMSAMEMFSRTAYRFEGGEWRRSVNNGKGFVRGPSKNYKIEGEKIILFDTRGTPEGTALFLRDGGIEERVGNVLSVYYVKE